MCCLYCGVICRAADSAFILPIRYQATRLRAIADRGTPYHERYVYLGLPPSPLVAKPATGPMPHDWKTTIPSLNGPDDITDFQNASIEGMRDFIAQHLNQRDWGGRVTFPNDPLHRLKVCTLQADRLLIGNLLHAHVHHWQLTHILCKCWGTYVIKHVPIHRPLLHRCCRVLHEVRTKSAYHNGDGRGSHFLLCILSQGHHQVPILGFLGQRG